MKAYRVLGTTDDVTTCELCGRADLKSTVALQPLDPDGGALGDAVYFGSDCAARAAGWTQREVRQAAGAADRAREDAQRKRRDAIRGGVLRDPAVVEAKRIYDARFSAEEKARREWPSFNERRTWAEFIAWQGAEKAAELRLESSTPRVPEVPRKAAGAGLQLALVSA